MKVEIAYNTLDDKEWWFEFGITVQRYGYNDLNWLVSFSFVFFTIYFRFRKK